MKVRTNTAFSYAGKAYSRGAVFDMNARHVPAFLKLGRIEVVTGTRNVIAETAAADAAKKPTALRKKAKPQPGYNTRDLRAQRSGK